MKGRISLALMSICSFIISIAPVTVYFITNRESYIGSYEDTVRLCCGGIICLAVILLKVIGRLRLPSSTVVLGTVFILSYLLRSITNDLIVFSFLALIGDIADRVLLSIPIKRCRERLHAERSADITAKKLESVLERYYRGGNYEG